MRLPLALSLAGLGYLLAVPGNLDDPFTLPLLALAAGGALAAAWATSPGLLVAGLGLLAAARGLQAFKGTLIGNWPFALPAWIVAAGLVGAFLLVREGRDPRAPFAVAALGTAAIAAWLATTGNALSFAGVALTTAGYALAALPAATSGGTAAPAGVR